MSCFVFEKNAEPKQRASHISHLSHISHSKAGRLSALPELLCDFLRKKLRSRGVEKPRLGFKVPNMGFKSNKRVCLTPSGLADALFSKTQQRVLAYLFGQPDRSFFAKELILLTEGGAGAIQRELLKLHECGLITMKQIGHQKHYQANPDSPIFEELCSISRKTVGLSGPLQTALEPIADKIRVAFIYGSIAGQSDHASSDIDLMIISDSIDYAEVFRLLEPVSQSLKRQVNPTILTTSAFVQKLSSSKPFLQKVMDRPRWFVVGGDDDIPSR